MLERPLSAPPGWRQFLADLNPTVAANGLIGLIFSATGPVAIVLSVGTHGGLSEAQMASWLFGAFALNGLLSILMCWRYRQPLVCFWTIPGTVLIGPALGHLTFPEVMGACYASGLLMLVLGLSGGVRRVMSAVPMPIVMGMVAGVFLRFGLDLVRSLHDNLAIAGPMVATWLLLCAVPAWGRRVPPILGALIVGALAIYLSGQGGGMSLGGSHAVFVRPVFETPVWSWPAMVELLVPLVVTSLIVQNGQGIAALKAAGHEPPINAVSVACGIGTLLSAAVGCACTCLAGPSNAIITSSGRRGSHYAGGICCAVLAIAFGVLSPVFTRLLLHTPIAFIMALAGLAMLRVLQGAFTTAFRTRFSLGALVAFLVTVADLGIANIGAAFWGLVAGFVVSWLLERQDFRALADELAAQRMQGAAQAGATPSGSVRGST
ncbi:MAG TPA: benzoate/H(+) symporter BenE family transporter [Bordetella sp.]